MMGYLVVLESNDDGFGAYVPDLPGCVAVGETSEEVELLIREAIELHVEDLRARGATIPRSRAESRVVELQEA